MKIIMQTYIPRGEWEGIYSEAKAGKPEGSRLTSNRTQKAKTS